MSDYSFMRTGLDTPQDTDARPVFNAILSAALDLLVESSLSVCDTYVAHANRESITATDLMYGLKYQTKHFMNTEGLETLITERIKELANETDEECESDDSFEDARAESVDEAEQAAEEDDVRQETTDTTPFSRSECTCDVCKEVNHIVDTWEDWQPEDEVSQLIKRSVDATCAKHS